MTTGFQQHGTLSGRQSAVAVSNVINHIALVLDASGSMAHLRDEVIKVADEQIKHLAQRSTELDQETRVTVYTFSGRGTTRCLVYDKDVLRLPSLRGLYNTTGQTALIDATLKALDDLAKTPELYGDHAFLAYILTDGDENNSEHRSLTLKQRLEGLRENWTVAAFVPNVLGKRSAQQFGFPTANIAIWNIDSIDGVREVGAVIRRTTDAYMSHRATGLKGTRTLFDLAANIPAAAVKQVLTPLNPGQYRVLAVTDKEAIAPFIERKTRRAYKAGEAFYELTKSELVQASKTIALMDKKTKYVYRGAHARALLNLPNAEVRVAPTKHPTFDIFIQSFSVNRNLMPDTRVLLIS